MKLKTTLIVAIAVVVALACPAAAFADEPDAGYAPTTLQTQVEGEAEEPEEEAAVDAEQEDGDGADASDEGDKAEGDGEADDKADGESADDQGGEKDRSDEQAQAASLAKATVKVADQSYTGDELKPAVTVKLAGKVLKDGVDYTVAYADNKEVGTAKATVTGIGEYSGEAVGEFAIGHADELASFKDLDDDAWYLSDDKGTLPETQTLYLDVVLARGVMLGYQDATGARTKFGPDDPVTRGQVVTMLYRLSHPDAADTTDAKAVAAARNGSGLPDVADARFYTAAVSWAVEAGVVSGYRDVLDRYYAFGANDPITREQLATMIGRFCVGYLGMPMATANIDTFSDASYISSYAKAGLKYCVANGIMTGYSGSHRFGPGDQATRCQMAKVMAMLVTLADADEDIAEKGWPTKCEWHGGSDFPAPAVSNWKYENGAWHYRNADNTNKTGFVEVNGNLIHFDENGDLTTGWFKTDDGDTYHFGDDGIATRGWKIFDDLWHHFDEQTGVFLEKTDTPDIALDEYVEGIASYCGHDLRRCYDYMTTYRQVKELDDRLHYGYMSDEVINEYATMVKDRLACDCYGDGAMMCLLARACGYKATVYGGECWTLSIGPVPHGWTELDVDGVKYICDSNLRRDAPDANWYMVTYETAPIEYYR